MVFNAMFTGPASQDEDTQRFLRFQRSGEAAIIDALLAKHLDRSYSQARRLLGNASEAEDAVQNAFMRILRSADQFNGTICFAAWLGRIVHNCAIDIARSRNRKNKREHGASRSEPVMESPGNADDQEREQWLNQVRTAILSLPEQYRASIDLHYFAGLSQSDTAGALGISENAVAKSLQRARQRLRSLLQGSVGSVGGAFPAAWALEQSPFYQAPPELTRRVLSQVSPRGAMDEDLAFRQPDRSQSSGMKLTAPSKHAFMWVSVGAAITLSLVAIGLSVLRPTNHDFYQRWRFDAGDSGEIQIHGATSWVGEASQHTLRLNADAEGAVLLLPCQPPTWPCVVEIKTVSHQGESWCATYRTAGQEFAPAKHWRSPDRPTGSTGSIIDVQDYWIGSRVFRYTNGQLTSMSAYANAFDENRIGLFVKNCDVDEIVVRTIAADEVPIQIRDLPENFDREKTIRLGKTFLASFDTEGKRSD